MRTVKEVADLTGVSTRTLQYYDEIGLLKPTKVNEAGYRFYDEAALERLQQILFFKEFDMSGYIAELEAFKMKNTPAIIKYWGSLEKFDDFVQQVKKNEEQVAKIAIQQFGSIEKYTEAMKYNMEHFDEIMSKVDVIKENKEEVLQSTDDLYKNLTADMTKPVISEEIQEIVKKIVEATSQNTAGVDMGEGFWDMVIEGYSDETLKRINDERYGEGASEYIAEALRVYWKQC